MEDFNGDHGRSRGWEGRCLKRLGNDGVVGLLAWDLVDGVQDQLLWPNYRGLCVWVAGREGYVMNQTH